MFAAADFPENMTPHELDVYLASGWFRMGQSIFTTNFLNFKNHLYSAVWLRIPLGDFGASKTQEKLIKANSSFTVTIQPAVLTPEKEALFATYKQNVSFEASASLNHLLYGKSDRTIFNTYEVTVYDGHKLIAVGYFDVGATSAAGISSFYDPVYKKNSLGKYLIFLKMEYCKIKGLHYFYPGYFVPGYNAFDYKLEICKPLLQYFDLATRRWHNIHSFSAEESPLQIMYEKLAMVQVLLAKATTWSKVINYEYFDANLIPDLKGVEVFDFPVFLYFSTTDDVLCTVVVYDVRNGLFHLLRCISIWQSNTPPKADFYASHLLKVDEELFSTEYAEELVQVLTRAESRL